MLRLKLEAVTALGAWVIASACETVPMSSHWIRGLCPRSSDVKDLGIKLSPTAKVYCPGSEDFDVASTRWSVLDAPKVNIVVVPGTENDVVETVHFLFLITPSSSRWARKAARLNMTYIGKG